MGIFCLSLVTWKYWSTTQLSVFVFVTALLCYFSWLNSYQRRRSKGLPTPPGPTGLPVIGNALDMPRTQEWLKVAEWAETYGDLVFLEPLGRPILFINSFEIATEILDKRSAIYSSRPRSVMVELTELEWLLSNMPYGEYWKKHRALFQKTLEKSSIEKYGYYQSQDAHKLLGKLLEAPANFRELIQHSIGATILRITYGHEAKSNADRYIMLAEQGVRTLVEVASPGVWLVEYVPWMRHVPAWLPGTHFKKVAKEGLVKTQNAKRVPYLDAKKAYLNGSGQPSITFELIENNMIDEWNIKDEEIIINSAAAFFMGGTDTTVASIVTFVLAMILFPDAQRKAQNEIDGIIGSERLPSLDDLDRLPYVEALCKETIRWQPIVPLGAPHVLTQDDVYNGYFLPKGTMVLPNQWYMLHDPVMYPDPEGFKPERHLLFNSDGSPKTPCEVPTDPSKIAFGFGRRACPGRNMALNGIFILISNILASFNIDKADGPDGKPIEPEVRYLELISHPVPFDSNITPRSIRHAALVRQTLEAESTA